MRRGRVTSSLLFLFVRGGQLGAASAQMVHGADPLPPQLAEPMPYVPDALGAFSHEITTSSPEAQAFFDQGFQLMIAFGKYEAVRSFREASRLDPECAMCYWGEAWAWGSYLNVPMADWEAPHAYAAMQKALDLRDRATRRERSVRRRVVPADPEARLSRHRRPGRRAPASGARGHPHAVLRAP